MKALLTAMAVLCIGSLALAGPNVGGTIIAHDANLWASQTDAGFSVCDQGLIPPVCDAADVEIDGATNPEDPAIFKVYAAFPSFDTPRLMGITWGVHYDESILMLAAFGMCGDFELNDPTWPASDTGSSVVWSTAQTELLVPVYWFAAYTDGLPTLFELVSNPTQGGYFGDDSVPAVLDPICGYGTLGFEMAGYVACATIPPYGACCDLCTGTCFLTLMDDCTGPDLVWFPEFSSCDPNPCPITPPGACCDPATGGCTLAACPSQCPPPSVWHPEWPECEPNPCEQPVPAQWRSWGAIKSTYR